MMHEQRHSSPPPTDAIVDDAWFKDVAAQLDAYFAGELTIFDVEMDLRGTEFQQRVWAELCEIPYGETISYGELAARIGNANASRAVGLANGRNPISIIVPCHRVIGADGSLTGYGGGLERKTWLLSTNRDCSPERTIRSSILSECPVNIDSDRPVLGGADAEGPAGS